MFEIDGNLAPYACKSSETKGRLFEGDKTIGRSEFQRDRDRIIHCGAFRKLMYKTQVFIGHEGDLFRTRLTHSIEVAQIARAASRRLLLNEDLTEALCLAHDLGHTPFGHAGQAALNRCLKAINPSSNGFEHNIQSLRIIDKLEKKYFGYDGLNLCFETREGVLKRCSRKIAPRFGAVAERFILGGQPSLEAQISNMADEIAYNHHDLDDGLRSGLITIEEILDLKAAENAAKEVLSLVSPKVMDESRVNAEIIRRMISGQIEDLVRQTEKNVLSSAVTSLRDVRASADTIVSFSPTTKENVRELKSFLMRQLYKNPKVRALTDAAEIVIEDLFSLFCNQKNSEYQDPLKHLRFVADKIAGLTDSSAVKLHKQFFPEKELWPDPLFWGKQHETKPNSL